MAGDVYRFNQAMRKWDSLRAMGEFSVAPEEGYIAVLASQHSTKVKPYHRDVERHGFRTEAELVARDIEALGGSALLGVGINRDKLTNVLGDRECTGLVLIGHGNFSSITADDHEALDWHFVSGHANHLKLGTVKQRFCGHFSRQLSAPFGLFAVSDHRNVVAPVGEYFAPEVEADHEELMRAVSDKPRLDFEDMRTRFMRKAEEIDEFVEPFAAD